MGRGSMADRAGHLPARDIEYVPPSLRLQTAGTQMSAGLSCAGQLVSK